MRYLTPMPGRDDTFESYYGSLVLRRQEGAPTAEEAKRDFEPVRRLMDKAVIF
ncbi:MAG: hypothetical protein IRY97_12030 [Thermomicrobiaceae bacterium]|nr:hypothetical protein [Thermomicrobiaceae bacterium]